MTLAVIGLDGFDMAFDYQFLDDMPFLREFIEEHEYVNIKCDTQPHSAPSWFTIFSGIPQGDMVQLDSITRKRAGLMTMGGHSVHGFYDFTAGDEWVIEKREGDRHWDIEMVDREASRQGNGFVWHHLTREHKHAVAQGIMMIQPHYSFNCADKKAYYDGKYDHWKKASQYCNEFQKVFDSIKKTPDLYCGVIQVVDQVHHHYEHIPRFHHAKTMELVDKLTGHIAEQFDDIIILSDHGMPSPNFILYEKARIKLHAHEPKCFLTTNKPAELEEVTGTLDIADAILGMVPG